MSMDYSLREELHNVLTMIFKELIRGEYILYQKTVPHFEKLTKGGMSITYNDIPDYALTTSLNWPRLTEGINMTKLGGLWNEQYPQFGSLVGTRDGKRVITIRDIINVLVTGVWENDTEFKNFETYINQEIEELAYFLSQTKTKTRIVALLENFYIDNYEKIIQLDKDVVIKKLTEDEIIKYQSDHLKGLHQPTVSQFAIIIDYEDDIIFSDQTSQEQPEIIEEIPRIIDAVVQALNIIKAGAVTVKWQITEQLDYLGYFSGISKRGRLDTVIGPMPKCCLMLGEVDRLISLYQKLLYEDVKLFEIALSRLSESELRRNPTDSIIDSVIGLESFLLRETGDDKYRGEMRWRFSINYATLFNGEERLERRKLALNAYDLRSKIVHGGRLDPNRVKFGPNKVPIGEAAKEIRDMLRYTLNYLINLPPGESFDSEGFWINRLLKW